jgi:virginiamycin B lyase
MTRTCGALCAFVTTILVALAVGPSASADPITSVKLPPNSFHDGGLVAGPDGNIWLGNPRSGGPDGYDDIDRITPQGEVTEFKLPSPEPDVAALASGPDGNVWFSECWAQRIGKITPQGAITEYPVGTCATALTAGSDGNIWFGTNTKQFGRISADGHLNFPVAATNGPVVDLIRGADGALWFSQEGERETTATTAVGRLSYTGQVTTFNVGPPLDGYLGPLALGPDGNIWFVGQAGVGNVAPDGRVTKYSTQPNGASGIAAGADHRLWLTGAQGCENGVRRNVIESISTTGQTTSYLEAGNNFAAGIRPDSSTTGRAVAGPDGDIWFFDGAQIGLARINPLSPPPVVWNRRASAKIEKQLGKNGVNYIRVLPKLPTCTGRITLRWRRGNKKPVSRTIHTGPAENQPVYFVGPRPKGTYIVTVLYEGRVIGKTRLTFSTGKAPPAAPNDS